jgi:hypothetical protein
VKLRKADIRRSVHSIPDLVFDDTQLTSCAGLVVFQKLFAVLGFKHRLRRCLALATDNGVYGVRTIFLVLLVHLLLGHRKLREMAYYRDDPIVLRVLGLRRLPDVATVSRTLCEADPRTEARVGELTAEMVLDRLAQTSPSRATLDFDGSVMSTRRRAEGTAVGFNLKRKGTRSYYPLLCTVAQTSQILDVLHRRGNVHDSNDALPFIERSVSRTRERVPRARMESRLDGAFFSRKVVLVLKRLGVEFTISVPFERLAELKRHVERTRRWKRLDDRWSYREVRWRPKSWPRAAKVRFILIRQKVKVARKGPLQLDLFEPRDHDWEYKVIATNKTASARRVLAFHNGRGSQEGLIGEARSLCHLDYIPFQKQIANQLFQRAAILAHNLGRELQMRVTKPSRGTTARRRARWTFQKLSSLRRNIICRAGRLTRPGGRLQLSMNANTVVRDALQEFLADPA